MGNCTPDDIERLQLALADISSEPKELALFMPAEGISLSDLSPAQPSSIITVGNNERMNLEAKIVTKKINGTTHKMYAYNGQLPGPTIQVEQGSTIYVKFTNNRSNIFHAKHPEQSLGPNLEK